MVVDILTTVLAVLFQGQHCTYLFHRHVVHDLTSGALIGFPSRCLLYSTLQNLARHCKGSAFSLGASK